MFLRSIEGNYSPSFFLIHMMTNDERIDVINNNKATLAHEYIHFLQDIIFPYCIRVNMSYFRWFDRICKNAKDKKEIKRPFSNWDHETSILDMQFKNTFGSLKDNSKDLEIKKIENSKETFTGYDGCYSMRERTLNVYKYEIIFNNNSKYQLGARDFLEYITYKIEKKHYVGVDAFPSFPYKSIDILFDYYGFSNLADDKKICIAERCMYNDNPVRYLINMFLIDKERMGNIYQINIDKLCNLLLNTLDISSDKISEKLAHKVERRSKSFLIELRKLYKHSEILCNWIERINSYSNDNFLNKFIFTELYNMENEEFEKYMDKLYLELGYPLLLNKKEKILNPNEKESDFEYLYILESFINFIKGNKQSSKCCPICKFCKANYNIKCAQKYDKGETYNEKCPYKNFLALNGLSDVIIT